MIKKQQQQQQTSEAILASLVLFHLSLLGSS